MINPNRTDIDTRLRREKSRKAIALALEGNWQDAVEVNRQILEHFPEDVEALNRLGKAFLELGSYADARAAFENATRLSPHNTIGKRNLDRLAHLQDSAPPPKLGRVVTPQLFIEESGKAGITLLRRPAPRSLLAKVASGDEVRLEVRDHTLMVENQQGEYLGQVEPKIGMRLVRLMNGGNRYDAAVLSVNRQDISVIIWEAYRHPSLDHVCSFPTRSKEESRLHWRDALLRYDVDSEPEEDDEEYAPEWKRRSPASTGLSESDADDATEPQYVGKPVQDTEGEEEE